MAEGLAQCHLRSGGVVDHADPCTCGGRVVPPGVSSTARPAPRQGEAGTASWRAEHCRLGDAALFEAQMIVDREVGDTLALSAAAQAWAAIAAAHYAAANVRYRA